MILRTRCSKVTLLTIFVPMMISLSFERRTPQACPGNMLGLAPARWPHPLTDGSRHVSRKKSEISRSVWGFGPCIHRRIVGLVVRQVLPSGSTACLGDLNGIIARERGLLAGMNA